MRPSPVIPLVLLCACGAEPELPELRLTPRKAELEGIRDRAPEAPDDERMAVLRDLLETAFVPGLAGARLEEMAATNLLEQDDAFWILEEGLQHADANVRGNAAFRLGQQGHHPSLLPLLLRLKYELEPSVMIWVADALAKLGNHSGLLQLRDAMTHEETANPAGLVAIDILQAAGRDPGEGPSYEDLSRALEELHGEWLLTGKSGDPIMPDPLTRARLAGHLLDLMIFQLRPVDNTRFVLARAGAEAVPFVRMAVTAEEDYLRIHGLEIAVQLGPVARSLAPDILPLLRDPLSEPTAIQALGAIGAPESLPYLLEILGGDNPELRIAVASALGPLGAPEAIPVLAPLVSDDSESMDLRVNAAFSLALLQDGGEGRAFLETCRDEGLYHAPTLAELLDELDAAER